MRFRLEIAMDNAAFDEAPEEELRKVVRRVAYRVGRGETFGNLIDHNGNFIGEFEIETD